MEGITDVDAPSRQRWRRHPADVARLVLSGTVLVVLLGLAAVSPDPLRRLAADLAALARNLPRPVRDVLIGAGQLVAVAVPPAVAVAFVSRRRWRLLAVAAAATTGAALAMAALQDWLDRVVPSAVLRADDADSFVAGAAFPSAAYIAGASAAITVIGPAITRRWRRAAWILLTIGLVLRTVTAVVVPLNLGVSVALGVLVGALTLLAVGSPVRPLDLVEVLATVHRCGVAADSLLELDLAARSSRTFRAELGGVGVAFVKVVGRDERNGDLLVRAWRRLRLKGLDDERSGLTPIAVMEDEALTGLLAGARAPGVTAPVLGVGETTWGDAVLVSSFVEGRPLTDVAPDQIDDDLLVAVWQRLAALHEQRIAHGWASAAHVLVGSDGPALVDLRWATRNADDRLLAADVAEAVVSLAASVGAQRAVESCRRVVERERLVAALSMVQKVLLSPESRAAVKADRTLLASVRSEMQEQLGVDAFTPAPLRRITPGGAVNLVGSLVLVAVLFAFVSNLGSIIDALQEADWSQLPLLLALVALTYVAGAMSLIGAVDGRLPFLTTTEVMLGQSFLNRFTPANAGGMAMRARYLQLRGVDLAVAAASVGITSGASGVMQVLLLLLFAVWAGSSEDVGFTVPDLGSLAAILALVLALLGVVCLVPAGRRLLLGSVVPAVKKVVESVRRLAAQPSKLALLFGGAGLGKVATITAFVVSCRAFDIDLAYAQLGLMYMTANTVASAAPTPGGVGAIEAALTAVLTARGVEPATALATVLVFRLMTYWLPVLPSYLALRHLRASEVV